VVKRLATAIPAPHRLPHENAMDILLTAAEGRPRPTDLDELAARLSRRSSPAEGLTQLVSHVCQRSGADVCSVYLMWETHQTLKSRLIDFVRRRASREARRRGEPAAHVALLNRSLSMDALTVGFARRFATYKRADLLFADIERTAELASNARTPVQFVFAGKSHPHDQPGKQVLQRIARLTRDPRFAGRLVFVEDYDINTCRHFVQGVDVWLNNPRRPLEASGTSGQKVVLNGGLNLSILDGWWAEAYEGDNGFAIGEGYTQVDTQACDRRDGESLFRVLCDEVALLLHSRPRRPAARVDQAHEACNSHTRLAVQRQPHGDRLRDQVLRAGGGRRVERSAVVVNHGLWPAK